MYKLSDGMAEICFNESSASLFPHQRSLIIIFGAVYMCTYVDMMYTHVHNFRH